jgi:hypothetical protein
MSPERVVDTFRFITGYAPGFREVAERIEREERGHGRERRRGDEREREGAAT